MDERMANRKDSAATASRQTRETSEETLTTTQERRKMFREFTQEALPSPPAKPGWHYVWLSTTNQYDPIYKRIQIGRAHV